MQKSLQRRYIYSLSLFLALSASLSEALAQGSPTWADDVACIIYSHCSSCHNPKGIAPFSMMSYEEVRMRSIAISNVVPNRIMPPWPADPEYRHFQGENVLTDEEISTIEKWIEAGSPSGDLSAAPASPVFESEFELTDPDEILELPLYEVPPLTDKDLYRCFVFPTSYGGDKFITGMEVIPGNPAIVHHVLVYETTSDKVTTLDNMDAEPGYICFGGTGVGNTNLIGGWVPGSPAFTTPEGSGIRLRENSFIVAQVHYPQYGAGESDSTKIRLKISDGPMREVFNAPVLEHGETLVNGPLHIPANTVKTFYNQFEVPFNATLYSVTPHAHLICESMKSYAVTPSGDTIKIVDVPKWDFDWQKLYYFKEPVILPAGTMLYGEATYNNTSSNHHNPNEPPLTVRLGEATDDEMMLFYFSFSLYQAGDETVVFDDSEHFPYIESCNVTTSIQDDIASKLNLSIFPNPTQDQLYIRFDQLPEYWRITDLHGRIILEEREPPARETELSTQDWAQGLYWIQAYQGNVVLTRAVMIE